MTIRFIRSEFRTNVARTICNFKNIYIIHSYSYLATKEFEIWTDLEQQPELKLSAILLFSSSLIAFVACERLELLKTEICVAVVAIRKLLVNFLGSFRMFLFLSVYLWYVYLWYVYLWYVYLWYVYFLGELFGEFFWENFRVNFWVNFLSDFQGNFFNELFW